MSTPAVTVYINGDSAHLSEELDKAIQAIRSAGGTVEEAATKFSMREARGSIVLLGDQFGIHMPREISRMIAAIPGIGVAMEGILPAMAAVWAVVEIEKYITKMREAEVAVSEGLSKALEATTTRNDELKVSIAETQLKIDKLLGKPISGDGVALEIAKARVEADKLAASLNTDLNEYIKLMDKASHGSIMAAIFGQTGEGQAGDVTKGLKDALAKIPKDATDYNERAAKAVQGAWQRAAYEINNNVQTVQANLNPALWQLQSNLSAVNGELDLLGKEDAIKKQEAQVEGVVAAAKREAAEFKRSSEVMHRVMEEMKRDAEEQERLDQRISNAEAAAAVANQNYADEIAAGNRKRVEEQVRVQQEGYNEDLSMAIKTAEEKEKAKTQAAKSSSSSSGEIAAIQAEVKEEVDAYQTRLTNLDKFSKDYENKVKELRDKIKQTEQKGNDETVQIYQKKAETIKKVEDKIADEVGRSVAKCIVEQKSMGQAAKQIGQKMQVCQLFCVNGQVLFLGMGARGKGAISPSLAQRL